MEGLIFASNALRFFWSFVINLQQSNQNTISLPILSCLPQKISFKFYRENIFALCSKSQIVLGNTFPFAGDKQNRNLL